MTLGEPPKLEARAYEVTTPAGAVYIIRGHDEAVRVAARTGGAVHDLVRRADLAGLLSWVVTGSA